MLVLTRKQNEVIHIGAEIIVIVVEIRGDKVRLGIDAPSETEVNCMELIPEKLRAKNRLPSMEA